MKKQVVVIEENFDAPIERVWQVITDKEKMDKWYFVRSQQLFPIKNYNIAGNMKMWMGIL